MKAEQDVAELMNSTEENQSLIAEKELEVLESKATLESKLETNGNLVHYSVPPSNK